MKVHLLLLILLISSFTVSSQGNVMELIDKGNFPPGFLKNIGQVRDFGQKPVDFVFYYARLQGQQVFITDYGLSILLTRPKGKRQVVKRASNSPLLSHDSLSIVDWEVERIDITLEGASILSSNISTKVDNESPQFNFYPDATSLKENVQQLNKELIIHNVYPGIDWRIYFDHGNNNNNDKLKYDFIVNPGANPAMIQLRYSKNVQLSLEGPELISRSKMGMLREEKPYSFLEEDRSVIEVSYKVRGNKLIFDVPEYDRSKTLVIDPSIFWLTYLSSTSTAWAPASLFGNDIETDASGNIFVQLSVRWGVPFPTVNPGGGAYYQTYSATGDGSMIIAKFSRGGQMVWCTYFGNGVAGHRMTIDKFGNIYAMGKRQFGIPSHPIPNPTIPLLNNGGYFDSNPKEYFITRFSNSGVLNWSTYYLNFSSYPTDMTYDSSGNIYIVGSSSVHDFPTVDPGGGAYVITNPQYGWAQTLFIAQFSAANNLVWATRLEGKDYDPYARICVDRLGNIYLGGKVRSDNYPLVNAGGYFNTSGWGSVLTRFNAARQMTWSTYFTGPFSFSDLTVDDSSNLYAIADKRILKFDQNTQLLFETSVPTTRRHFWEKIQFDPHYNQIQILGVMSDPYIGFPTINTACNGSFFNNGISPHTYFNATGPIFATINRDGSFTYRSLVDWVYESYDYNEMSVDPFGDVVYLFGDQRSGFVQPNPQLTNPGSGAYFDPSCCNGANGNISALLLKLTTATLLVDTVTTAPSGCACNGSASATPQCGQQPFQYLWSNGDTDSVATGLCPGNYWVKVTDANNLSKTINILIPYPPGSVSSAVTTIIPENCDRSNGIISVQSVQGGTSPFTYSLDGVSFQASAQFIGLDSGSYIIRVRDALGCVYNDTVVVDRVTGPASATYNTIKSSCRGDDGQLLVSAVQGGIGPYTYSLNGSVTSGTGYFQNLAAGPYLLTVTDTAGCQFSENLIIEKAVAATEASIIPSNDHCDQHIGTLQVSSVAGGVPPFTFSLDSISFTSGPINNLAAGNYFIYVKDSNGCVLKKGPITISGVTGPDNASLVTNDANCGKHEGSLDINNIQGGVAPYLYAIDGNNYFAENHFDNLSPGIHTLFIKDAFGCIYTKNFQVLFNPLPEVQLFPIDTTVCYDQQVMLRLTGELNMLQSITWNIPAQGNSAIYKASGDREIVVTLKDNNNCEFKDTSIIKVNACNPPEKCIAIPSAFTPNNDNKNDRFGPLVNGCRIESMLFKVFNRWGEIVYQTRTIGSGWNGIYKGIEQPSDVYIYTCEYTGDDGIGRLKKGVVTLIR